MKKWQPDQMRTDPDHPRSPMKKHWLATPKPFITWGIFMGLMTGD
jgi:hypothetical protein